MTSGGGGIWYVQHYAGGPGIGRYGRGYELARRWIADGTPAVVIGAARHHSLDSPQQPGPAMVAGVPYEFVPTPAYQGNGFGRVWNMAAFTARLWSDADIHARRYGVPRMIIASSPQPYLFAATHRTARRFGALSVFEVRDLWPLSLVELGGVRPWHPLALLTGRLERFAYKRADHVVSLLPHTLPHMQERGLAPERWHYIPNGIDGAPVARAPVSSPALDAIRAWRRDGKTVVVYSGALGYPNNVGSLVAGMARLLAAGEAPGLHAIIVGRGEEETHLRDAINKHGLADRIAIFEQVSKEAALSLIAEADAGYISLRASPVFRFGVSPNKLLDYMAAGIPVVSAIAAGNDPVTEAGCGFVVAPDDPDALAAALSKLAAMPAVERKAMGKRGRAFARLHYDYDVLAERYRSLADCGPR